jgi:hypothetical protein
MRSLNALVLILAIGVVLVPRLQADESVTMNGFFEYEWNGENNDAKLVFRDEVTEDKYSVELADDLEVDDVLGKRLAATGYVRSSEEGLSTFVVSSWKLLEDEDERGEDPDTSDDPTGDDDDDDEGGEDQE